MEQTIDRLKIGKFNVEKDEDDYLVIEPEHIKGETHYFRANEAIDLLKFIAKNFL